MRLAVLATGSTTGEMCHQSHKTEINTTFRIHHGLGQFTKTFDHFGPALHGQKAVGNKAQDLLENRKLTLQFGVVSAGSGFICDMVLSPLPVLKRIAWTASCSFAGRIGLLRPGR